MSFSNPFRSFLNKKSEPPADAASTAGSPDPAPINPSQALEAIGQRLAQERAAGQAKNDMLDKELRELRAAMEKLDASAKASREAQNQTLHFLQHDAEHEIKYFERKLKEDMAHWDKQLKEREKILDQTARQSQTGLNVSEAGQAEAETAREAAEHAEALLKEQEVKLAEERQKWRELLQTKETELATIRQELSRREDDLAKELAQQESQRKASQDLWQSRLKDLERQWADKRKSWEDAMKAKEEERARLSASFQEKQAAWQLEQERKIQEVTRRQERAQEKLAALKAHLVKETQNWQQLSQGRDEQVQQLKVKLLLSESETKGQLDQAEKIFQESIHHITSQIQTLQQQLQEEQAAWQAKSDVQDQETRKLKEELQGKLRRMETDFNQRMGVLQTEKDALAAELARMQADYKDAQAQYTSHQEKTIQERAALEAAHQEKLFKMRAKGDKEAAALQEQITSLEAKRDATEKELDAIRLQWQDEINQKEKALKEVQATVAPQEEALRKKYAAEEELVTGQVAALKVRQRTLERDLGMAKANIEKALKEQADVRAALESDHKAKEEALRLRSEELMARLQKRLDERRVAMEAFMVMKKNEETRIQQTLKIKEKERADLSVRLKTLPQELEKALQDKKEATQKEAKAIRGRLAALEAELTRAREESKSTIQAKATELAGVRQTLEQKHKEVAETLHSQERILESERAQVEKQMAAAQAETDRFRSHWLEEIEKKEKEAVVLRDEMAKQEVLQRQALEQEQIKARYQIQPLEEQRDTLTKTLETLRTEHDQAVQSLESQKKECLAQIQISTEQERSTKASLETRLREERAQWKARLAALGSEREGVLRSGREALEEKSKQIEDLEERVREQAVAHEARRRELIHQATLKSRTLQDIIHQLEQELKSTEDLLPQQLQERDATIAKLREALAAAQAKHERTLARYERALATLERRGREKEKTLKETLGGVQEEWAKKLSGRDVEIAALQSELLAKESERQGELDRLAKQFAEERFQLEKAKEELEWKLKDRKEVAERQLATRQKEIHAIENDIHRAKAQRDQEQAKKSATFEAEKQKLQIALASLEKQIQETRQTQEAQLAAKEQELQTLLARSKEHLRTLGEEFNQKVGSWRATNDALKAHIEQLKTQVAEAQDHWEALRKEKTHEVSSLRQELAQWEARIKSEAEEFDRTFAQERTTLLAQIRSQEKALQESLADYERRLANQDESIVQMTEEIRSQEENTEAQWHATLEQWQTDKQALQQQKVHLEQELVNMQSRFQNELRQADEAIAKLKMDVTFKETHATSQKERLQVQLARELDPLHERLARVSSDEENERTAWETKRRAKEDEVKTLTARLAMRDKRVQDENRRRITELDRLRKQVTQETGHVKAQYEAERSRLEKLLLERREALAHLQATENDLRKSTIEMNSLIVQAAQQQRRELEDHLKAVLARREQLRAHYEGLMKELEGDELHINKQLDVKEIELEGLRDRAGQNADELRKKIEFLRRAQDQMEQRKAS